MALDGKVKITVKGRTAIVPASRKDEAKKALEAQLDAEAEAAKAKAKEAKAAKKKTKKKSTKKKKK